MGDGTVWQAILGEIELSVSRGSFVTWFKNTRLQKKDDAQTVIAVPNIFVKNQLERKYDQLIKELLKKNGLNSNNVEYKISSDIGIKRAESYDNNSVLVNAGVKPPARGKKSSIASVSHSYRQGLNERYTFENFVVGSANELAYAACEAVAANPGSKYNPLFLYGGVGIGKTHLIQAVGNAILSNRPEAKVVYVSTEQFVQEFLDAIRFKKNTDFAGHYRNADVLIIDDMQFIAGKEKTQEEFFHTFNALHQANKQIIISSDKPPKDIPTLEERLKSRFAWGMSIDMQTPDFETRCVIVKAKAGAGGVELPTAVMEFLANRVPSNIRELEGALNQLLAYCEMKHVNPDIEVATAVFGAGKTRPRHLSAKQVVEKTAKYFQIPLEDILGPKRDKDIVMPRQVAMYILRSELHLSFPKIAHELGRKDHTTAIHSVDKIERELGNDAHIKQVVSEIKERLYV